MDDLISRQAAIDAITKWEKTCVWDDWCDDHRDESERYHIIPPSTVIRTLPSAEPEIIRCKDCKHYHTDVFGGELGLSGIWKNIIVAHNACDKWTKDMNCVTPDGFCFLAERRTDANNNLHV